MRDTILYLKLWFEKMQTFKAILQLKLTIVVQLLLKILDTPICLFGIKLDDDALPLFFPTLLYPFYQEPKDGEGCVTIVDKKVIRHFDHNHALTRTSDIME